MRRFITVAAEQVAELVARSAEDGRLSRGRTLFRRGSVSELVVHDGSIVAAVRGSQGDRYETTIATAPAPRHVVAEIARANDPGDRWRIDDLVADGLELCPGEIDLAFSCDCGDWEELCKHVVATFLAFVDRVDLDPSDLLRWRGVDPPTSDPDSTPTTSGTSGERGNGGGSRSRRSTGPDADAPAGTHRRSRSRSRSRPSGDEPGDEATGEAEKKAHRAARLSELESLLGDTVVRLPADDDASGSGSGAVGGMASGARRIDGHLAEFLGVGRSIDAVDISGIDRPGPLFAEAQLGPLVDLGPALADALRTIQCELTDEIDDDPVHDDAADKESADDAAG